MRSSSFLLALFTRVFSVTCMSLKNIHYLRNRLASLMLVLAAGSLNLKAERWEPADPMTTVRSNYSAVSLADGRVLVSGGETSSGWSPSITLHGTCEIYDPSTDRWTSTGSMITPRSMHASVLLDDGRVLALGGHYSASRDNYAMYYITTNKCEIYDPSSGTWSPAGNMHNARAGGVAILMPNKKILITGGILNNYSSHSVQGSAGCEIYDPNTNIFYGSVASMPDGDYSHKLILLQNGHIFKICKNAHYDAIYDYISNTWEPISSIGARNATLLNNGDLFACVDGNYNNGYGSSIYTFSSLSKKWSYKEVGGPLPSSHQSLITLPSGKVLFDAKSIYDPISNIFTPLNRTSTTQYNLLLLPDGRVLTLGDNNSVSNAGTVGPDLPMVIAKQPASLTIKQGDFAEFSVTARGVSVGYLWMKNGKNLAAQTRTLSLSNVQPVDQGTYQVIVYSAEGVLTSQAATLTVIGTPIILNQPRSVLSSLGQLARFTVTLAPDSLSGVQYKWFKNGLEVPNSNSSTLTLSSVKSTDVGIYHVVASNEAGLVTSDSVRLDLYSQELFQSAMAFGFDLGFESGTDSVIADPNSHGLYSLSQVQGLHVDAPLLAKDPTNGKFKLTIGIAKSTDLVNFSPMPIDVGAATINSQGKMEFEFNATENAAFYRLESR